MPRLKLRITNARGVPALGLTLLLGSLSMISPLSIDTFLPSLPTIAAEFHLSAWQAQQIITAYLLPFAAFSLVHGPLSDALGRRRVVLGGLALYTSGALGCFLSPSFGLLLFCRVLQGSAAGIGSTVARAVVRDLFDGANAQRLMSSMTMVFSLAPAVAPILGGWLHITWGWRSVFAMLLLIGLVLGTLCTLLLPETHPPEKRTQFHPVTLIRSCWHVATDPAHLLMALAAALSLAALFAYIGSAPAIVLSRWHLRETQFYYVFIPVVIGFMSAAIAGRHLAGRVRRHRQLALGFGLLLFSATLGVVANSLWDQVPILLVQFMLFLLALAIQVGVPILTLEMLDMQPNARGAAASVQSFLTLSTGAVAMGMIAPLLQGDLKLLAWLALASGLAACVCWRGATALRRRSVGAAA